jgi:hypothetical protein
LQAIIRWREYWDSYTKEIFKAVKSWHSEAMITTLGLADGIQRIPVKITQEMNSKLCAPIELDKLELVMKAMACEKAPGPDGITIEFFRTFWKLDGPDYLRMIRQSINEARFPNSAVHGLITLLHKGGDCLFLGN